MSNLAAGKPAFIAGLVQLQKDMLEREVDSFQEYAERMADLVEAFIKTGKVTVEPNIAVATTGTATAQTGKTTATGTGSIS